MKESLRILLLVFMIATFGCTSPKTINEEVVIAQLDFLQEGLTSKIDIQSVFGEPQHEYENGRTIIYSMCPGENGQLETIKMGRCRTEDTDEGAFFGLWIAGRPWNKVIAMYYNLVLVFNEQNVLIKHNLLRIR